MAFPICVDCSASCSFASTARCGTLQTLPEQFRPLSWCRLDSRKHSWKHPDSIRRLLPGCNAPLSDHRRDDPGNTLRTLRPRTAARLRFLLQTLDALDGPGLLVFGQVPARSRRKTYWDALMRVCIILCKTLLDAPRTLYTPVARRPCSSLLCDQIPYANFRGFSTNERQLDAATQIS